MTIQSTDPLHVSETTKWLRHYSDRWDMPVDELYAFIRQMTVDNYGSITETLDMLEAPVCDRHIISEILAGRT